MPWKTLEVHQVLEAMVVSISGAFAGGLESSLVRNVVEGIGLDAWAFVIGNLWDLAQETSPSEVQAQGTLGLLVEGYIHR